ncbi:MAG: YbhB/YbcL family Raf kinase inhibitor-like protein [Gammaproteobacteria bacterium]|jgi:Raf kinase inhibitor-like YbhB/YbcL family protein|nr:YbhB/YbcL family Raf kinase inhibitor-like protein [Gammaproteobacteria bacterium]
MKLTSTSFANNEPIPDRCAFGIPAAGEHMTLGPNLSPQLSWSELPADTRSLALVCVDTDVPSVLDDVNQEGRTLPASLPRVSFTHWVMVDIPAAAGELAEGACSNGVTPGGKQNPHGPAGSRQGLNDFTGFMAGNADMAGQYFGYDGPCPPWNDELVHHYRFKLFALNTSRLELDAGFTAMDAMRVMRRHIIDQVELTGTYTLVPELRE